MTAGKKSLFHSVLCTLPNRAIRLGEHPLQNFCAPPPERRICRKTSSWHFSPALSNTPERESRCDGIGKIGGRFVVASRRGIARIRVTQAFIHQKRKK